LFNQCVGLAKDRVEHLTSHAAAKAANAFVKLSIRKEKPVIACVADVNPVSEDTLETMSLMLVVWNGNRVYRVLETKEVNEAAFQDTAHDYILKAQVCREACSEPEYLKYCDDMAGLIERALDKFENVVMSSLYTRCFAVRREAKRAVYERVEHFKSSLCLIKTFKAPDVRVYVTPYKVLQEQYTDCHMQTLAVASVKVPKAGYFGVRLEPVYLPRHFNSTKLALEFIDVPDKESIYVAKAPVAEEAPVTTVAEKHIRFENDKMPAVGEKRKASSVLDATRPRSVLRIASEPVPQYDVLAGMKLELLLNEKIGLKDDELQARIEAYYDENI